MKLWAAIGLLFAITQNIYAQRSKGSMDADTIFPKAISGKMQWRVGAEIASAYVFHTNDYISGNNARGEKISATLTGTLRGDFSFNPRSKTARLYQGVYQGLGVDVRSFFRPELIGTPVSLYILQGAPVKRFSDRLWLGYEWRFGCAFGWVDRSSDYYNYNYFPPVCTRVSAHMGVSLKLHYAVNAHWQLSGGVDVTHFSNGNTSFPNPGFNTGGISLGVAYVINPDTVSYKPSAEMVAEADHKQWIWDVLGYGSWRKRTVQIEDTGDVLPGTFGVAGIQFTAARKFNRYFDAGMAVDLKYDDSAGKEEYWIDGYYHDMRFSRVPFLKKCSLGIAAVAEFTMPVFTIGAGVGVNAVKPSSDKILYQLLYIKAFLNRHIYLNIGYRLGNFKDPENLMLGAGYRF